MSRLERQRKKQSTVRIVLLLLLLSVLIVTLFSFGINFLINTSIFLANFSHKKNSQPTPTTLKTDIFHQLQVGEIQEATNEASFVISGQEQNFDKINFYLNDEKVKTISPENEDFQETLNGLKEGKNTLYLEGIDKTNDKKEKSSLYEITYTNKKPALTIEAPSDGSTTDKNEVDIKGETEKDVFIKINNRPIIVDAEGKFNNSIRLKEGENEITIEADDLAGNQTIKKIKVTYSKDN